MTDEPTIEVKLDPEYTGSGTTATLRWYHLEEMLKQSKRLHANEKLTGVKVTEHGLQYYIGGE